MMPEIATDVPSIDYRTLSKSLNDARKTDALLHRAIVDAPFKFKVQTAFLFLGVIVLLQVDPKTKTIRRMTHSGTQMAQDIKNVSNLPFEELNVPLNHETNLIACTIRTGERQETTDWVQLLTPPLTAQQARVNQAAGGIAYTAVYPLKSRAGGALSFNFYEYPQNIGEMQHDFMERYVAIVDEALR